MLTPLSAQDWNYEAAAHLLNRAGFGGTPDEISAFQGKGLETAVDSLLQPPDAPLNVEDQPWSKPVDLAASRQALRSLKGSPAEQKAKRKAMRQEQQGEVRALRYWWLEQMHQTSAPLIEKMTLFWHGHFATSVQKVRSPYAMWRQNATLREQALGHFPTLLKAISRDPAMQVYLDLQQSKKDHPNENWAREVMELFTLGIGNYTEEDVQAAARAFTGYRIDPRRQAFAFAARQHDDTSKTFLGQRGNFSGDDVLDLIVAQPVCAQFIGKKLWRFFVEDDPAPPKVQAMGDALRRHCFHVRPVLREVFRSREFYSERVRRTQIKSPVQFLVQSCKLLGTDLPPAQATEGALRSMGQIPFNPPNVKGWDGGKSWVSTSTLLFRYNFANYLLNGTAGPNFTVPPGLQRDAVDFAQIAPAALRQEPEKLLAELGRWVFQAPLSPAQKETLLNYVKAQTDRTSDETIRHVLHLMMSTPQFQLT
ncbi:MAG: DUF1800 domain-containing protein [Chthoniobacterales bacterium]